MSYTHLEAREAPRTRRPALAGLGRLAGMVVWAVINAALLFAEQLAELLAPILLLAGGAWWAIPRAMDALKLDGPANDVLQQIRAHVPAELAVGGDFYSAHGLIVDGLLCVGVVAICRTLSVLLANLLLERA